VLASVHQRSVIQPVVHIVYSLFLFTSAFVFVYCIFLYVCIFSFDATILVNKDTTELPLTGVFNVLKNQRCGVLVNCGTPTPILGLIVWYNDCVLKDDLTEILKSSNKRCTVV